jgi:hypothetical protein
MCEGCKVWIFESCVVEVTSCDFKLGSWGSLISQNATSKTPPPRRLSLMASQWCRPSLDGLERAATSQADHRGVGDRRGRRRCRAPTFGGSWHVRASRGPACNSQTSTCRELACSEFDRSYELIRAGPGVATTRCPSDGCTRFVGTRATVDRRASGQSDRDVPCPTFDDHARASAILIATCDRGAIVCSKRCTVACRVDAWILTHLDHSNAAPAADDPTAVGS